MEILHLICDIIILIGGVMTAICGISAFVGKPIKFFKTRADKANEEKLNQIKTQVADAVIIQLQPKFDEINRANQAQQEIIDRIQNGTRDMLRESILRIYEKRSALKKLTIIESEVLDKLFVDYKQEGGNGHIEKLYKLMSKWEVVDPSELDENYN